MYNVSSEEEIHDTNPLTDVYLADQGYITLVPLKIDQTNYEVLQDLSNKL